MTVLEDGTKQINYETALTKLDQSSTTFEAYKGKIVVVNFGRPGVDLVNRKHLN